MISSRQLAPGELRERFYQSVAETLALLHAAPGHDRRQALAEVARILARTMDLPLVWIGRREPGTPRVEVLAAAGSAAEYTAKLHLSNDEREPGGQGPVGIALREERARLMPVDAPEFSHWRGAARRYGFGACIVAAARSRDDGQLLLAAYSRTGGPALGEELLDWAQRLVDELSRFWDHQILLERSMRMSRYRDAQRTIQRALLEQPDPEAVYLTLAQALVDIAGAAAVDVFASDGDDGMLRRVAVVGPIADILRRLPMPPRRSDGPEILAPTQAFMQGSPVIRRHPQSGPNMGGAWRKELLDCAGAVGCWPLFASSKGHAAASPEPAGVVVVVTVEADAFDGEMCRLLDEIADAAGLALWQHSQRRALLQEQERQTYLALHDDLTGLPNRRALDRYLENVLARAERRGRKVAVGLLDLDDLKPINDRHGHAVGDLLLIEVANRFRQVLRTDDYVARLGGDEFVLVFEDLEHESDIDDLLQRVGESLRYPMVIGDESISVGASLGIAMYSNESPATGEQLVRRADQAMYQVKSLKRSRSRWWVLARGDEPVDQIGESTAAVPPYGEQAAAILGACRDSWEPHLPEMVKSFHAGLHLHEGVVRLLGMLPESDAKAFEGHLLRHLENLLLPDLTQSRHHARASRSGFFHAGCGLEEVWLLEAVEQLRDILASVLGGVGQGDSRALAIVLQRLGMERQWQLESMRELQRCRVALLARLNALAWSADGYLELIQGVVDILASHQEVIACAVGRPDASGQLTYEAVAGTAFSVYLRALDTGQAVPIRVDSDQPEGLGPSGRAWRTATIQRCEHYGNDPLMAAWRDIAMGLGVVSNIAIPLCPSRSTPAVILTLYSPYAGAFQSEDQRAFVDQIKTVLDLALARLAPPRQGAELLPFFVRERWRALVATDALEMHYQPLVRLADGQVAEFEALARLRDDGELLTPYRFLPALGEEDLLALFRQALLQATAHRATLGRAGFALDMSVNAPAVALEDARYAEVAASVIAASECPPQALLFEILESPLGTEHAAAPESMGISSIKTLGVRLVEDDLGAGYSSLIRLRQWPFDRIKIDQAIVAQVREDPLGTLRFIRQLIRIGHDLCLEVVVEGLELPDLIEAATILGADFGQGYALARPMPADAMAAWLSGYLPRPCNPELPQTGLGALAGELRWEEQFVALPADPAFWAAHAATSCGPGIYLEREATDPILGESHQAMHDAALSGPSDPGYRRRRQAFLALLVEHVLAAKRD